jgi:hypothetical protein
MSASTEAPSVPGVSEAEFDALLKAARTAARVKSDGNDGDDTGSTPSGPGCSGEC